jgi:hypothetical protein
LDHEVKVRSERVVEGGGGGGGSNHQLSKKIIERMPPYQNVAYASKTESLPTSISNVHQLFDLCRKKNVQALKCHLILIYFRNATELPFSHLILVLWANNSDQAGGLAEDVHAGQNQTSSILSTQGLAFTATILH